MALPLPLPLLPRVCHAKQPYSGAKKVIGISKVGEPVVASNAFPRVLRRVIGLCDLGCV
jgi:hypothetical protein